MFRKFSKSIIVIGVVLSGLSTGLDVSAAKEDLKPPFGVDWEDPSARIAAMLEGSKAKVVAKRVQDGRDMWVVEGIRQAGLKQAIFYFKKDLLNEVELQYSDPEWTADRYMVFTTQVRENIERKHGMGQTIARSRTEQGNLVQNIIGYKWINRSTVLKLFYYSAERKSEAHRLVSLHYISRW